MTNPTRVQKLLEWLDLPAEKIPSFYTLYFDTVDSAGHKFGPGTLEVAAAAKEVDESLGILFAALREKKIFDQINILIVSDHGMATLDPNKVISISDVLVNYPDVDRIGGTALASFFSSKRKEINRLEIALKAKSKLYIVYKKKEIPTRYHYRLSNRIPDLLLVANQGVTIQTKPDFMPDTFSKNKGAHGYDNKLPAMQAVFYARGPSFLAALKVRSFENVNLYSLMCHLLDITPSPNSGSLKRLPRMLKK